VHHYGAYLAAGGQPVAFKCATQSFYVDWHMFYYIMNGFKEHMHITRIFYVD